MTERPDANRRSGRAGDIQSPPDLEAHPLARSRTPEYVIVLWTSQQLRDRLRRNNAALATELQNRDRRRHGHNAEPSAEIEAEP